MPFPKKVTIAERDYKIILGSQEDIDRAMPHDKPGKYKGLCSVDDAEIYVHNKLKGALASRVLLHEMLHALVEGLMDPDEEETVVSFLEERVAGLFRNNPKLIDFLKETL